MEQIKLLSMTAILSLLVWMSADSLVNETVSIGVTVEPVASASAADMILEATTAGSVVELQVSGPRRIVDDLKAKPRMSVPFPVAQHPTGPATIFIDRETLKRELSSRWSEFRKLAVVSVLPDSVHVTVDHWVTRDVEVSLDRLALAYDVAPQIPRTTVTVRMRESRLNALPAGQRLQVAIGSDVERLLRERPAGESVTIPVTLDARAFGPEAELTPPALSVTATVKAERTTAEIPTVPILFAVSSANLERRYRPTTRAGAALEVLTRTITVTGPTDAVTNLQRGVTRAKGIIHLKQADLEELDVVKVMTPEFQLPPGVELAEEPAPVEFKLIDTTAAESGG